MGEIFKNTLTELNLSLLPFESLGIEASAEPFKILTMYLHYSFTGFF